jgi:multidrug resistance efflux pump
VILSTPARSACGARPRLARRLTSRRQGGAGLDSPDTNWAASETRLRAEQGHRPSQRPYQAPADYPVPRRQYPAPADYPVPRRQYPAPAERGVSQRPYPAPAERGVSQRPYPAPAPYSPPSGARQVSRRSPAPAPVSLQPAIRARGQQRGQVWIRRRWTWPQRIGGLLIAGACVAGVAWYVPRVVSDDRQLLTGTVTSSGVITLNFAVSGEIGKVDVHLNQPVRKGQLLAAEYAPNVDSVVAADKAAIAAEKAKMAELRAAEAADPAAAPGDNAQLSAENAQLALDEAQLATDDAKAAATEIVAPSSGIVIAANGAPGQTVTSSGLRTYVTDSQQAPAALGQPFSLLPEGPQSVHRTSASQSALPVIALRISASWQVVALIPEDSISRIKSGQGVIISVPAASITVGGRITEVLSTPTSTPGGVFYEAVVTITGHPTSLPLNGMTADIRLSS